MNLRWLRRDPSPRSANIARERLLKDRTLRRNRYQIPPALAVPFPATHSMGLESTPSVATSRAPLSPRAQKWQIIATARHFDEHYLAELAYHEAGNFTVAVIRPYLAPSLAGETSFQIRVDGRGHTSIVRLEEERNPHTFSPPYRFVVVLLVLAALTSGALALFL